MWVEVRIENYHSVSLGQIEAKTASFCRQEKHTVLRLIKFIDQSLSDLVRCISINFQTFDTFES